MKLYRDEHNDPRAEAEGDLAILAAYLESDVQEDKEAAIELLQFLERKHGERIGNAYSITFDDKYVSIEPLHDAEGAQKIGRNIFFQAVEAWIVFISD